MTDLDKKLQGIANNNWEQFMDMVGREAIVQAKSCLLRQEGKSYHQIAVRLNISDSQARWGCTKCDKITC